jgi:hypothetical protein
MKPDLAFEELRGLIEILEVEGVTLPVLLIARVLVAGELNVSPVAGSKQRRRRAVEAVARRVDRNRALGQRRQVGVFPPQDQRALMRGEGQP